MTIETVRREYQEHQRYISVAQPGDPDLGPLQLLPGKWVSDGRGWNMIALPFALGVDPATGKRYFWEIRIPGSIVGLIVGYATQKFGQPAVQRT